MPHRLLTTTHQQDKCLVDIHNNVQLLSARDACWALSVALATEFVQRYKKDALTIYNTKGVPYLHQLITELSEGKPMVQ